MYCKFICVFALLIIGALATNYKARNCEDFGVKVTKNGKYEMGTLYKPDKICWYAKNFDNEYWKPGCCIQDGKIIMYDMTGLEGEKWNQCINIRKGTVVTDVSLDAEGTSLLCNQINQKLKKNVINVRARCNNNGCLTRYGWVTSYYKRRNC